MKMHLTKIGPKMISFCALLSLSVTGTHFLRVRNADARVHHHLPPPMSNRMRVHLRAHSANGTVVPTLTTVTAQQLAARGITLGISAMTAGVSRAVAEGAATAYEGGGSVKEAVLAHVHNSSFIAADEKDCWVLSMTPPSRTYRSTDGNEYKINYVVVFVEAKTGHVLNMIESAV